MKIMRTLIVALLFIGGAANAWAQPHAAGYVRPHSEVEANKPTTNVPVATGAFTADWNNLAAWECPEWFRDAKFGIWAHWDPQCEAEDGDWYARSMYGNGNSQWNTFYNYFGHYPSHDWGYKDFCRYWTVANWNPQELIALYASAGAKYFMAMGQHHDNYDCWDSPYQEWNSMNIGPKRDIVGEWAEACREYGLKLGVSMHGAHAWTFFEVGRDYDTGVTKDEGTGTWWEGYDPQELYAQDHDHSQNWSDWGTIHSQWHWGNGVCPPSVPYMQKFQNRVLQCINKYNPDMVYFDDTVLPFYGASTNTNDQYSLNILQHFYNTSAAQHNGEQQVVVCGKILNDTHKQAMLWDVERGTPDRCQDLPWQTCTCIGGWHYSKWDGNHNNYKQADQVVRMLIDIVSKNGNLLLSIPVRGDGSIDNNERNIVNGIKAWMDINKESIHGTRPWKTFGEGPTAESSYGMNEQGFNEGQTYSSADVRYVQKNGKVYATIMHWPSAGDFTFKSFSIAESTYSGQVTQVTLLGYGDVAFSQGLNGLTVTVPSTHPNNIAPVFCITLTEDSRTPYEQFQQMISDAESLVNNPSLQVHPFNTGKVNTAKLEAFQAAIAEAQTLSASASESELAAAREALAAAYREFQANGLNRGGVFSGVLEEDKTTDYFVEATGFTRSAGGTNRFGKPANWTVENFNIPNGGDGTKQGLDKYSGNEALMLGVWNDAGSNTSGDLSNARIYRRVSLPAGRYYFGAAYNAAYQLSEQAYMFVSTQLGNTADIPTQSIAYYNINKCPNTLLVSGLYFQLDEPTQVYIGFQANLLNGSSTQEFRAERVALYAVGEDQDSGAWQEMMALPEDPSQYFYTITDLATGQSLVIGNGNHQGASYKTMWYQDNVDPKTNKGALWTFDTFDSNNNSGANNVNTRYINITNATYPDICMQSYDGNTWNYRTDNNGEGWVDRAYVAPSYLPESGWRLRNYKGGDTQYIGRWDADGNEVAGNKENSAIGNFEIKVILRGEYVAIAEDIEHASAENPIDITYVITNPDGTRKNNFHADYPVGWKLNQDGDIKVEYGTWLPTPGRVGDSYFNIWQGSGNLSDRSMSQQVTGLPNGQYRLTAKTTTNTMAAGAFLFANNDNTPFNTPDGDGNVSVVTNVTNGTLQFGVRLENYQSNDCKFDHFTLEIIGTTKPGDVDANGVTDTTDLQKLVRYLVDSTTVVVNPDVDGDGDISLSDVTALVNLLINRP